MGFEVHFEDETTTQVLDADAYEQEGPLTTFFDRNGGGGITSAFALRVASVRTRRIVEIRPVSFTPPARRVSLRWHTPEPAAARWGSRALANGRLSHPPHLRSP